MVATGAIDGEGKATGVLASARDITDLRAQERELQEKNEEFGRFTYTVSHDLKSPLVTIRTFLGYLEKDAASGDAARVQQDLSFMRSAAEKMSRMLDELLELSRIGRSTNPAADVTLQELVADAVSLVAGRLALRDVEVVVTDEPLVIHGDRPRLVAVFQNLLDNAVKFMGDQASPRVEIGVGEHGGVPAVFVKDNGAGIDPRHIGRVFGLFEKLQTGSEGVGMGLAVVKRIVEVHGGRVWAESAGAGAGTTFWLTIPPRQADSEECGS